MIYTMGPDSTCILGDINLTSHPKSILPAGPRDASHRFMRSFRRCSYAESHDGVDDVVVVLPESLDGLLAGHISLGHNQFDVLSLKTRLIDLLAIILFLLLLGLSLGGLALAVVVLVVVTSVLVGSSLSKLLGSGSLSGGVQVLDLGLTEDAVATM